MKVITKGWNEEALLESYADTLDVGFVEFVEEHLAECRQRYTDIVVQPLKSLHEVDVLAKPERVEVTYHPEDAAAGDYRVCIHVVFEDDVPDYDAEVRMNLIYPAEAEVEALAAAYWSTEEHVARSDWQPVCYRGGVSSGVSHRADTYLYFDARLYELGKYSEPYARLERELEHRSPEWETLNKCVDQAVEEFWAHEYDALADELCNTNVSVQAEHYKGKYWRVVPQIETFAGLFDPGHTPISERTTASEFVGRAFNDAGAFDGYWDVLPFIPEEYRSKALKEYLKRGQRALENAMADIGDRAVELYEQTLGEKDVC